MSLKDDLLRLAALDRRVVRAVIESDWEDLKTALSEYQALRKSLRTRTLDQPVVSLDNPDATALLSKIATTGEGLPTDKVIKHLYAASGSIEPLEERWAREYGEDELDALGSDLFYSWFSHYEYITGLAELRPLVVRDSIAENVSLLVRQIKNCYAFQQYEAAYGLCRTLIEASVRDICVRRQLFPNLGENVILFENFNWTQLRDKVSSGSLRERLSSIYRDLSATVHVQSTK